MKVYKSAVFDNSRWQGFKPRPGDIFVCTPAKCGTTWTQTIVASLLFPDRELPAPLMQLSPWIEMKLMMPVDEMHAMLEAQTHRRVMKSHTAADGIPWFDDAKYVFVGRAGLDVFMSWCNHVERMRGIEMLNAQAAADGVPQMPAFDGDVNAFFPEWLDNDGFLFEIVRTFWEVRQRSNLLFVHFNDLKADLDGEMRRIAAFLDIGVPEALWDDVVASCVFENMRKRTDLGDFDIFEGGREGFLFKGTNGRWKDLLTEDEVAAYHARAAESLPADAAAWLEGGQGAVDPSA